MKNLVKKAIEKAKTAAKDTMEGLRDLTKEEPGFCLAMTSLLVIQVFVVHKFTKQCGNYINGWNDGAEETRKSLITALVNNRIGHGESEADAFKLANGLVETVERK